MRKEKPHQLVGKRIRLVAMPDDPAPIPVGSLGTVENVVYWLGSGAEQQIWVKWDNGRSLHLCVPPDRYEVVTDA